MQPDHPLSAALGHRFARPDLLTQALTHPSVDHGRRGKGRQPDYERLEFLGDRVLGLVVADMLFRRYPDEPEGALARRFTALVRREAVARVAERIGLGPHLAMARGDEEAGGRSNQGILADACEAVIGALFADAGYEVAAAFVRGQWSEQMEETAAPPKDAKTALQEWAQGRGRALPAYRVVAAEGPPHDPVFEVAVVVAGLAEASGRGPSKRVAEQAAAAALLKKVME
ncbi:ribonuclease III [Phaeospirillum tilakii]|uniref:Ribonuclease 3 n=1 Tax=Phaeospirillum tilakii TaxID=741673 RepID=A0ABW5CAD7_9PROT